MAPSAVTGVRYSLTSMRCGRKDQAAGGQLGHSRVSMTQDRYLGRKLTDRQTAEVLEKLLGCDEPRAEK
jgi:hypothetical protein